MSPSQHTGGRAPCPAVPTLSSSHSGSSSRDLHTHPSDHIPGPCICGPPAPQHPARACVACLPLCLRAHHLTPLMGLSLRQLASAPGLYTAAPSGSLLGGFFSSSRFGVHCPLPREARLKQLPVAAGCHWPEEQHSQFLCPETWPRSWPGSLLRHLSSLLDGQFHKVRTIS